MEGAYSGERKHKKQDRAEKKVKQGCGSGGFGVVPQGALEHKLYHKVDLIFKQGATLYPSSVIGPCGRWGVYNLQTETAPI